MREAALIFSINTGFQFKEILNFSGIVKKGMNSWKPLVNLCDSQYPLDIDLAENLPHAQLS